MNYFNYFITISQNQGNFLHKGIHKSAYLRNKRNIFYINVYYLMFNYPDFL